MLWRVATVATPKLLWAGPLWCQQCERKPRRVETLSLKKKKDLPNVHVLMSKCVATISLKPAFVKHFICCVVLQHNHILVPWFCCIFCLVLCCKTLLWFLNFLNNHVGHNYSLVFVSYVLFHIAVVSFLYLPWTVWIRRVCYAICKQDYISTLFETVKRKQSFKLVWLHLFF